MKRHRISSRTRQHAADGAITARRVNGNGTITASRPGHHLRIAADRPWSHTLVLKGDLDHHSAAELEDELVCLLEEGVSALTLDLRQLDELDPRGAQVIALQSALYKGRGRRFGVLVGSPAVHCTLAAAAGPDLLGSADDGAGGSPEVADPSSRRTASDLSTTLTRELGLA
jgi:anti-anti-sigma regulatory factor